MTGSNPMLRQLVDQIGFGHRGEVIEREMGINTRDLASLRRRLKRRAQVVVEKSGWIPVNGSPIAHPWSEPARC